MKSYLFHFGAGSHISRLHFVAVAVPMIYIIYRMYGKSLAAVQLETK
jgi:hypothetical protein